MKNKTIAKLITSDEGRQRLAHAMVSPIANRLGRYQEPFVYKPSPPGHKERAYARYLHDMAGQETSPSIAAWYSHMAEQWDAYAKAIESGLIKGKK